MGLIPFDIRIICLTPPRRRMSIIITASISSEPSAKMIRAFFAIIVVEIILEMRKQNGHITRYLVVRHRMKEVYKRIEK